MSGSCCKTLVGLYFIWTLHNLPFLSLSLSLSLSPQTQNITMLRLLRTKWASSSPIIKSLTTISPSAAPSLTLHFLQNSCRLSPDTALFISKKIHLKTTKKAHAVLSLLKSHSFSLPDIASIVSRHPKLLLSDPDNTLKPKLDFFQSLGLSAPDLVSLLSSHPSLLLFSLDRRIIPNLNLLGTILPNDYTAAETVKSFPSCLIADLTSLLPKMTTLHQNGVPLPVVLKLLTSHPRSLSTTRGRHRRVEEVLQTVRDELHIEPSSPIFPHAYRVLAKLSSRDWDMKVDCLKRLGWSEEELASAFAKHPYFMTASTEKLERNMRFFKEEMRWEVVYAAAYPVVLSLSFEKRIVPRCRVLKILQTEGLFDGRVTARQLMLGKEDFLKRYVTKFQDQVPGVVDAIQGKIATQGEER